MGLAFRKVRPSDVDLLYEWANDKAVRANSFNTEQIPYESHVKWFAGILDAETVYQYILCEDGIPVGQLRLNTDGENAVISFSVSPERRGEGLGSAMLKMLPEQIRKDKITGVTKLTGMVKRENAASAAAFEKCGYTRRERPECLEFTYCPEPWLYIRADGNAEIGMGHIMRCLSIAEAVCEIKSGSNEKPVFLTADSGCADLIRERGFAVEILGTDFRDMHSELPVLKRLLPKERALVILVDSYQADSGYFDMLNGISELVHTACLEDMGQPYPAELLINYNIYAPVLSGCYRTGKKPLATLLGAEYIPLRKAFREDAEYKVRDNVTNVMIITGGSDPYFASDAFLSAFLAEQKLSPDKITWHIVSGPFNAFADRLREKYRCYENVIIHEGLKDLKPLMKECDVALTAAGSTVYELSAPGVPMLVFYFAENQRQGAQELARRTDIVNAGCFCDDAEAVVQRAALTLRKCVSDRNYRELLHRQERELVDGKGAERIAAALLGLTLCNGDYTEEA
ncbi:MAG: UDP-2,4-diacetamido-2,4,6-trideoxy-beta-L-altropyranose hydrolase [Lachnospiraceae bacterium]|nr:UDP-2,4-diacetamido-2,4,6-trideoxy-beta-L-altropyranose hydrolase [Lachnospiraceae bacterium]